MKRTIQIELELEKETPDFLDKVMGRIYIMDEVKKTGMEAKYVDQEIDFSCPHGLCDVCCGNQQDCNLDKESKDE